MISYSFLKEAFEFNSDDNEDYISKTFNDRKRIRKRTHNPQSRQTAKSGTIGSFSSITSKYNNVYNTK